jgi:hypothetical protein
VWPSSSVLHKALLVDGGGLDGGEGAYVANAGDDLRAVLWPPSSPATSAAL